MQTSFISQRCRQVVVVSSVFLFMLLSSATHAEAAQEKSPSHPPNIVIIFIDDMGYADIGPFGATAYKTPHLDGMAKEGRIFTDFHSEIGRASCRERV